MRTFIRKIELLFDAHNQLTPLCPKIELMFPFKKWRIIYRSPILADGRPHSQKSILAVRLGTGALLRVDIAFMRSGIHTPARKREHTSTRAHTHKHTLTHKQTRIYVHKYRAAWEISKKPEIQCTCNHKGINVVTNSTFLKLNVCCSLNLNRKCFMHLCLCLKGCLCVHVFAYLFVDVFVCVCVWGKNVNLHCRSSAYHKWWVWREIKLIIRWYDLPASEQRYAC